MSDHFSDIGLIVGSQEALFSLAQVASGLADSPLVCEGGVYAQWRSPCGASLWVQRDPDGALMGVCPHFDGPSRVRVGLVRAIRREEESPLDGAWYGWASPEDESDPETGCYPFVFDMPNARIAGGDVGAVHTVQLAAFALEIEVFADEEALTASDAEREGPGMASRSFVPVGLFPAAAGEQDEPTAHAMLSGEVLASRWCTNGLSSGRYCWAQVETFGGVYDVVTAADMVRALPEPGAFIRGVFWLSGRILD